MLIELVHSLLTHKELSLVGDRVADQVIEASLGLPYVDGLAGLVKKGVYDLDLAMAKSLGLETTPEVQAADVIRDRRFKALRGYIEFQRNSDDENIAGDANFLNNILRKHGLNLWSVGMAEESVRLKALKNDFSSEKAKAALKSTGAMKLWLSVDDAQTSFEKTVTKRSKEAAEKDDPKVKESRTKVVSNLQALLLNLQVAQSLEDSAEVKEKLAALMAKINRTTASTMTIARARITRNGNPGDRDENKPAA